MANAPLPSPRLVLNDLSGLDLSANRMTMETRPRFGGTREPGERVRIKVDDRTYNGSSYGSADEKAVWDFLPEDALAAGQHQVEVYTKQRLPSGEYVKTSSQGYNFEVLPNSRQSAYQKARNDAYNHEPQPAGQEPVKPGEPYQGDTRVHSPRTQWARQEQEMLRQGESVIGPDDMVNPEDYVPGIGPDGRAARVPDDNDPRVRANKQKQWLRDQRNERLGGSRSAEAQQEMAAEQEAEAVADAGTKAAEDEAAAVAKQQELDQAAQDLNAKELAEADRLFEQEAHQAADDALHGRTPTGSGGGTPPTAIPVPGASGGGAQIETGGPGVPPPVVSAPSPMVTTGSSGQPGGAGSSGGQPQTGQPVVVGLEKGNQSPPPGTGGQAGSGSGGTQSTVPGAGSGIRYT